MKYSVNRRTVLLVVIGVLLLGGVGFGATALADAGRRAEALEEARVLGANSWAMNTEESFDGKSVNVDATTGDQVILDEAEGYVATFSDASVWKRMYAGLSQDDVLSDEELLAAASAFIAEKAPRWASQDDVTIEVEPLFATADGHPASFQATVVVRDHYKGLETGDQLSLTLDPTTGDVASFKQSYGPIDLDVNPTIGLAQAESIAVDAAGGDSPLVRSSGEPSIWRDPSTRKAHLVRWIAVGNGPESDASLGPDAKVVAVDLHSGEVLAVVQ